MASSALPASPPPATGATLEDLAARQAEDRVLLQRLLHGQEELREQLRADFGIIERYLARGNWAVAEELRQEGVKQAKSDDDLKSEKVMATEKLARHTLPVAEELRHEGVEQAKPDKDLKLDKVMAAEKLARYIFKGVGFDVATRVASRNTRRVADAVRGERLLIAGGSQLHFGGPQNITNKCESMDLDSASWVPMPAMTFKRVDTAGAVVAGCLYVCGGLSPVGRSVVRYNPANQLWNAMPSMLARRAAGLAVAVGQELHIFGGHDSTRNEILSSAEFLCPNGDADDARQWREAPALLVRRMEAAGVGLRGEVLISGGTDMLGMSSGDAVGRSIELLHPSTRTRRSLLPSIVSRQAHAAAVVDGKVYLVGGLHPRTWCTLSSVEFYDPALQYWTELTWSPLPFPRCAHEAVVSGGRLIVLGGLRSLVATTRTERCMHRLDLATGTWEEMPPMKEARCGFVAGVVAASPSAAF